MSIDYTTGEIVEPLTSMERSALVHAEAKIERGLASFIEVGEALSEVRDSRLYRADFSTFEAYCRERWGITDRRARQMIDAATTVGGLPTGTMVPTSERQARELHGLAPEQAAEVMREAVSATGGKLTAAAIREARTPQTPQGEAVRTPVTPDATTETPTATPRPAVTGLDGKTYTPRPTPQPRPRPPMVDEDEWSEQDRAEELAGNLARNLSLLYAVTNPERRAEYIATWRRGIANRPVLGQNFITPTHMRSLAEALRIFADEWEAAHV